MLISHNEVLQTTAKALEAIGWSRGEREDGAEAIAWFELHGLSGVEHFVASVEALRSAEFKPVSKSTDNNFDAYGQSCLRVGPLIVDWCLARSAETTIANCSDPSSIIPYLVRMAKRGQPLFAAWEEEDGKLSLFTVSPTQAFSLVQIEAFDHVHLLAKNALRIGVGLPKPHTNSTQIFDSFSLKTVGDYNLANGIVVDDAAWSALKAVALGILVPESEASRLRGAGDSDEAN